MLPNGTLKIANVTRRDAASYTCIAKNQFGTATTTGRLLITGESCILICLIVAFTTENPSLYVSVISAKLCSQACTTSVRFAVTTNPFNS